MYIPLGYRSVLELSCRVSSKGSYSEEERLPSRSGRPAGAVRAREWRGLGLLTSRLGGAWHGLQRSAWGDAEGLRFAAWVSVWGRWVVWVAVMAEAVYQPELNGGTYLPFIVLHVALVGSNGLLHRRLATNGRVTWPWVLGLSVLDFMIITTSIVYNDGFGNFHYLAYYPALALVAVICPSFALSLLWTTVVAAFYGVLSTTLDEGLDFGANDQVVLLGRLMAMYGVVVVINLVARYERTRRYRSAERERALLEERVQLSQTIHDTAAQSAYMLGLGVETARMLAGDSNKKLNDALDAASLLSKSLIWELRRSIDGGLILEGLELSQALRVHVDTFSRLASLSVELVQLGDEPPLPVGVRSGLFSVAHNALSNAFLHSQGSRVCVTLDFRGDPVRLSVSDDGVGLPEDYARRGRGFSGMSADADRMAGKLIVGPGGPGGGTDVTCEAPLGRNGEGD